MNIQKKFSIIIIPLILGISLLAPVFQPAASAATTATCTQWHTVEKGEYLVLIARMYGTDWRTLADLNNLATPSRIYPGQKLCVSGTGSGSVTPIIPITGTSTRVYASSVKEDKYATLRGVSLTANSRYTIYLSKYASSTLYLVGYATTDKNGAFTSTFNLPSKLVDVSKIGISIYNKVGDNASNWFINATASGNTGGINAPAFTFSVLSSKKDTWVTIKTNNMPANVPFDVLIGKQGTKGEKGTLVGTLRDGDGVIKATFDIPSELQGKSKFDIRLQNKALGIYTYLTVDNKTKP